MGESGYVTECYAIVDERKIVGFSSQNTNVTLCKSSHDEANNTMLCIIKSMLLLIGGFSPLYTHTQKY